MKIRNIIIAVVNCLLILFSHTLAAAPANLKYGMVVSAQKDASEAGLKILRAGGNAIDAAVAVGYALAVVNPCCGNIGGGGFMTIHLADGDNLFLNFREKAPLKASKKMFIETEKAGHSTRGYLAVGVPGTVLGFETALQRYGTMTRQEVMAPAISLAEKGYKVTSVDARLFRRFAADFENQANIAAIFLKDGKPYKQGERLIQHNLARTLKKISKDGPGVFYKGSIAKAIVKASQENGGLLSMSDFEDYTVQTLKPVQCHYRGYTLISSPPPSSGGTALCETLNILENASLNQHGYRSVKDMKLIIEAMRQAFIDRNMKLGDPDFVNNPVKGLLSEPYAKTIYENIIETNTNPAVKTVRPSDETKQTTHYSIIDAKGNAVSVTYTLNGFFGAKVIASDTGFFLNNQMDDFASNPGKANQFGLVQYEANAIAPGKRPLSSMTPTIVMKDNQVYLVIGSPGGPRIITSVLLSLLNIIDYKMDLQQAVNMSRFHYQNLPDVIYLEPSGLPFFTIKRLELMGYHFLQQPVWGAVEAIRIDPVTNIATGANDGRRPDGAALSE